MQDYKIAIKEAFNFIGLPLRISSQEAASTIAQHWEKFYKENLIAQIPNRTDETILGLYTDYEKDFTQPYTLIIGSRVFTLEAIPDNMVGKHIPASLYAVYKAKGQFPQSVQQTWERIWHSDLKRSYSADFESYDERFFTEHPELEIYVSLEK